ncbi:MAG: putative alpha-L-rhamnosidase [Phycisphaerales bacterium]|nr:putative alpha-L-rhamnosidase [Phycisphaerales bacterium]
MLCPFDLTLSLLDESLGIERDSLQFCWKLNGNGESTRQSAYRIRVASTQEGCLSDSADYWDSGRVESSSTLFIASKGQPPSAHAIGYWSVVAYDEHGIRSIPAVGPIFSIAPGDKDWHDACWIGADSWDAPRPRQAWRRNSKRDPVVAVDLSAEAPATYLKRMFTLDRPVVRATLTMTGLGCFVVAVNSTILSAPHDPACSAYDKNVLFRTYDASSTLVPGTNQIDVTLGNGLFNLITPDLFGYEQAPWRGSPRALLCLRIEYDDGIILPVVSDGSWLATINGPIRFNCLRGGETIDARSGLDQTVEWRAVEICAAPRGKLRPQIVPPVAVSESRRPTRITNLPDGRTVIDFGGPLVGAIRLKTCGVRGSVIDVRYGESLAPDGSMDLTAGATHTYGRYQTDRFILAGTGEEIFTTTFAVHAFRYVQIEGLSEPLPAAGIEAIRFHTRLKRASDFDCSDPVIVRYHNAARRTLEDCTFGLPCAEMVREKIAWCGDFTFTLLAYSYLFDSAAVLRRVVHELADAQAPSGHVPPIHPNAGWGRLDDHGGHEFCDDPWWGGSLAEVAAALRERYGDGRTERESIEHACRYVDYVAGTRDTRGCVTWSLGDWCDLEFRDMCAGLTPVAFTSTFGLARIAQLAANALASWDDERAARYRKLSREVADAVNRVYLVEGAFDPLSQTMQSLGTWLGALTTNQVREAIFRLLVDVEERGGQLSCGFIGLMPTLRALADAGRADLALNALFRHPESGILRSLALSGTPATVGEAIHARLIDPHSGSGSFHHQFGAAAAGFLYECVAGLRPDVRAPGWQRFFLRPAIDCGLTHLDVTYESPVGRIGVKWQPHGANVAIDILVPCNAIATLQYPNGNAREFGPGEYRLTCRKNTPSG